MKFLKNILKVLDQISKNRTQDPVLQIINNHYLFKKKSNYFLHWSNRIKKTLYYYKQYKVLLYTYFYNSCWFGTFYQPPPPPPPPPPPELPPPELPLLQLPLLPLELDEEPDDAGGFGLTPAVFTDFPKLDKNSVGRV